MITENKKFGFTLNALGRRRSKHRIASRARRAVSECGV